MSGGHFEYRQHHIGDIADEIERELNKQGKQKSKGELWNNDEFYKKYPEEMHHGTFSPEIQAEFKNAINALKIAEIYAQRIDWFLSGDDGEESFLERLSVELKNI